MGRRPNFPRDKPIDMKSLVVLALFAVSFWQTCFAQKFVIHRMNVSYGGEESLEEYLAPLSALTVLPGWEPGKQTSPPPIARAKAFEIVREELSKRGITEIREDQFVITLQPGNLDEKELRKLPPNICRWHYVFSFSQNVPKTETVVVLMDGSLAEIKITAK